VKISIVYLGRRGGGKNFTESLVQAVNAWDDCELRSIVISGKGNLVHSEFPQEVKVTKVLGGNRFNEILKVMYLFLHPSKLSEIIDLKKGYVVFPMVSPLDLVIARKLKNKNVKIIRFIHDHERHPGEKWPGKFTVREMVKTSDYIVSLNSWVGSKLRLNFSAQIIEEQLPVFNLNSGERIELPDLPKEYFLFIGRIKKYKGLENLLLAYQHVPGLPPLVVAGEGHFKGEVKHPNLLINKWLNESEILELIRNAKCVIFPYLKASQSGLIPIVRDQRVPIMCTSVGGLVEQLSDYPNKIIVDSPDYESISKGLIECQTLTKEQSNLKIVDTTQKVWLANLHLTLQQDERV
jgi:glycosyltransferase involved in cell wall biosynthesis